jgi:hypothetical protein
MWTDTLVLAERIKGPLFAWTIGLILAATAADQSPYANAAILPLSVAGVIAQTFIVTAALRVGLAAQAQAMIRPRFARVLGIGIVSGLAILLGALLLVIPGVILLIRWWISVPVALDRDISVSEALRQSWEMTAPHWASILGLFVGLLALLAAPMIGLFFLGGLDEGVASVPMALAENFITYTVMNLGTVSTVAVYRTIYQSEAALRQVFE